MARKRGAGRPTDNTGESSAALEKAAGLHFAARGYEATPLRQIASDAGVDVALISYHFGGKLGVWKAVVARAAADLHDALTHAVASLDASQAGARLRRTMAAYIAYLLKHPEVPRLILRDSTIDSDRSDWLLRELSAPLHQHFFELAQAAAQKLAAPPPFLQFRVANFIYSAASSVARRDRLTQLVVGMDDIEQFSAALETLLIDEAMDCG